MVTNDKKIAHKCRLIRNHAESIMNENEPLSNMIGSNYRMGEIEAAIGIAQLKKLKRIIKSRQKIGNLVSGILNQYDFIKVYQHLKIMNMYIMLFLFYMNQN